MNQHQQQRKPAHTLGQQQLEALCHRAEHNRNLPSPNFHKQHEGILIAWGNDLRDPWHYHEVETEVIQQFTKLNLSPIG